jgi:hypothetical protein
MIKKKYSLDCAVYTTLLYRDTNTGFVWQRVYHVVP